jgi:iron complex outermembrane recepter protein
LAWNPKRKRRYYLKMEKNTLKLYLFQILSLCLSLAMAIPTFAKIDKKEQARHAIIEQLKNLSLDDLIQVETFNPKAGLAARKVQKLSDTAAALFVITQEDIRRAGITRIAEALRMVPGVQVARIDANKWAISARGLNGQYTSKLLVMVDGRSVYTQLRSEVFWDVQDLLIEDIERIEVIRGPGASLWGANAVNGVINIVTKSAKETQGTLLTTHFGHNKEQAIIGIRQGGELENGLSYRIYGKFYEHENFVNAQGQEHNDNWEMKRGGFRLDWENSERDTLTFQGDAYQGTANQQLFVVFPQFGPLNDQVDTEGFNLLGRWQRDFTHGNIILQTYLDHTERQDASLGEIRKTYDIDFQHRWQRNETQEIIWGLGFHHTRDHIKNSIALTYEPDKRGDNLFSAFIQGEFLLNPDLRLTAGTKVEHNDYTGFEIQPTLRGLWTINPQHSLWAAISRAVRTPSRSEANASLNAIIPTPEGFARINSISNQDFQSENLLAYELGYRFNLAQQFLLDMSLFFNQYDKLRNLVNKPLTMSPILKFQTNNQMYGEIFGLELATHWQVLETWRLVGTYSYLQVQLHLDGITIPLIPIGESEENENPHHQATLRSLLTLPHHLEFDTALYYVDNVPQKSAAHYLRTDVRLGWKPISALDLSIGVRNLFDKQHREFGDVFSGNTVIASEVPRTFYLQLKYQFE